MSPFDLRGPEFLLFYLVLGVIVLAALHVSRRLAEPTETIKVDLSDPYLIACLRGGTNEVLRVSTISLIHRGLLQVSGTLVSIASPQAIDGIRNPVERELLLYFNQPREASSVFSDPRFPSLIERYNQYLENYGLLPNRWVRANRERLLGVGLLVLWGVALIKIVVALSRGHTNLGLLLLLSILFGFFAFKLVLPRLTLRGKAMLADMRVLFSGLTVRPATSFTPADVALLAAVFGAAAIPVSVFPHALTLYPKAAATESISGRAGSSCGSVSSCSSSGGCGGGGCGGGCGGCGS
jgi:uncharacterized protein (TIGR04222 family)